MRIEIDIPDEIAGQLPADEEARDIAIIEGVQLWLDVKDDAPSPEQVREILLEGVAQYRAKLEDEAIKREYPWSGGPAE